MIPNLFLLWCMWVAWVSRRRRNQMRGYVESCTIAFWTCIGRRRQGQKRAQRLMKEKLWLLQIPKVKRTRLCNHQESPALVTIHECCWWSQHHTKLRSTSSHCIKLQVHKKWWESVRVETQNQMKALPRKIILSHEVCDKAKSRYRSYTHTEQDLAFDF